MSKKLIDSLNIRKGSEVFATRDEIISVTYDYEAKTISFKGQSLRCTVPFPKGEEDGKRDVSLAFFEYFGFDTTDVREEKSYIFE